MSDVSARETKIIGAFKININSNSEFFLVVFDALLFKTLKDIKNMRLLNK